MTEQLLTNFEKISPEMIHEYQDYLFWQERYTPGTVDRKIAVLRKFCQYLEEEGYMQTNPFDTLYLKGIASPSLASSITNSSWDKSLKNSPSEVLGQLNTQSSSKALFLSLKEAKKSSNHFFRSFSMPYHWPKYKKTVYLLLKLYRQYHAYSISNYINISLLCLFLSIVAMMIYNHFFTKPTPSLTSASSPTSTRLDRYFSFEGKLNDPNGGAITVPIDATFSFFDDPVEGNTLYFSGSCHITPDENGIFTVQVGSDCGSPIPAAVFSENLSVYLGIRIGNDEEMKPRQRISAGAVNHDILEEHPPSATAQANQIPIIDPQGRLVLASQNPQVYSTSGSFQLRGQTLSIVTDPGSKGNITLAPDVGGVLNLSFAGSRGNQVSAMNANLSSGTLYYGAVGSNATGFDFIRMQGGNDLVDKFRVEATGAISTNDSLTFTGNSPVITASRGKTLSLGDSTTPYVFIQAPLQINGSVIPSDHVSQDLGTGLQAWHTLYIQDIRQTGNFTVNGNVGIGSSGTSITLNGRVNSTIIPLTSGTYDIGSSSLEWNNLYAKSLTLSGNQSIGGNLTISGNVGIGTNTPGASLDVVGNGGLRVGSFAAASSSTICQNNNFLSTCTSSRKFKDQINPLSESELQTLYQEIQQMTLNSFVFKGDQTEQVHYGLIAEEAPKRLQITDTSTAKPFTNLDFYSQWAYAYAGIKILDKNLEELKASLYNSLNLDSKDASFELVSRPEDTSSSTYIYTGFVRGPRNELPLPNFKIIDQTGKTIEKLLSASKAIIAHLEVGVLLSSHVVTDQLWAGAATINRLTAESLKASKVFADEISAKSIQVRNTLSVKTVEISDSLVAKTAIIDTLKASIFEGEALTVRAKLTSPLVETYDIVASGTAKLAQVETSIIRPVPDGNLVIDLNEKKGFTSNSLLLGEETKDGTSDSGKLIIKGEGDKGVVSIDDTGNIQATGNLTAGSIQTEGKLTAASVHTEGDLTARSVHTEGDLTARSVHTEGDLTARSATLSGTLQTHDIITNGGRLSKILESLEQRFGQIKKSDQYITNIYNIYNKESSSSGETHSTSNLTALSEQPTASGTIQRTTDTASPSALLAEAKDWPKTSILKDFNLARDVPLASESAEVEKDLIAKEGITVLGKTSLSETYIYGPLLANGISIADSTIESFMGTLFIEKHRAFPINIMNGLITIDTKGDLIVEGNVLAKGGISTGFIRPLADGDLVVDLDVKKNLAPKSATEGQSEVEDETKLIVKGQEGKEVASIDTAGSAQFNNLTVQQLNSDGDATVAGQITSGSLITKRLTLKADLTAIPQSLLSPDQIATIAGVTAPGIQTVATSGTTILPANTRELVIINPNVTINSQIYVTPQSQTGNNVLYIASKRSAKEMITQTITIGSTQTMEPVSAGPGYFRVAIDNPHDKDIAFNWLIVEGSQ